MRDKSIKSGMTTPFWHLALQQVLSQMNSTEQGLSSEEAKLRLSRDGANRLNGKKPAGPW